MTVNVQSVEINTTTHCNLSCYGCDHASPLGPETFISLDRLEKDLAALAPVYHVFEFRLTGGEPLMHPNVVEIVDIVRASGISDKVTVVTNGVLLHRAPEALWTKIDKLWVSLYPGVKRKMKNPEIEALAARHGFLLYLKVTNEFTRLLQHAENPDPELIEKVYSTCLLRASCHTIHEGRYYKCTPAPFMKPWLEGLGIDPPAGLERDCVELHGNPDLEHELETFLRNDTALTACRFCLGTVGEATPSRQMNPAAKQAWLDEAPVPSHELIDDEALADTQTRVRKGLDLSGMIRSPARQRIKWQISALTARARSTLKRLQPGG